MNINGHKVEWPFPLKLLIGASLWFISFSLFSLIGIGIASAFTGLKFSDIQAMNPGIHSSTFTLGLKIIQLFEDIGMFVVPALFLPFIFFQKGPASFIGFKSQSTLLLMLLAILLILCIQPLISITGYLNEMVRLPGFLSGLEQEIRDMENKNQAMMQQFLNMHGPGDFIINIFIVAVLPAFAEELFFRGFVQRSLQHWMRNENLAVIFAALIFSFIHFEFYGFVPRFLLGLLMGYAYLWSGDLKIAMLIHFTNNFFDLSLSYFMKQDVKTSGAEPVPGFPQILFLLSSMILLAFLLYVFKMRAQAAQLIWYEGDQNEE